MDPCYTHRWNNISVINATHWPTDDCLTKHVTYQNKFLKSQCLSFATNYSTLKILWNVSSIFKTLMSSKVSLLLWIFLLSVTLNTLSIQDVVTVSVKSWICLKLIGTKSSDSVWPEIMNACTQTFDPSYKERHLSSQKSLL